MWFGYSTDAYNQRRGVVEIYVPSQGGGNEYAGFIFLPRYKETLKDGETRFIYQSTDSGETWSQLGAKNNTWKSVSSSSDGTIVLAVASNDSAYVSTDSGVTWEEKESGINDWVSSSISDDGVYMAIIAFNDSVYVSSDSGATWSATNLGQGDWQDIASSSDGSKMVVAGLDTFIYTSGDYGATWTQRYVQKQWKSVSSSGDGVYLAAVASNEEDIYLSNDSGVTWFAATNTFSGLVDWAGVAISDDGTKITAVANGDYIYVSDDSGSTWTQTVTLDTPDGTATWNDVVSTPDGNRVTAIANELISNYSNPSWTSSTNAPLKQWLNVTSSNDGVTLYSIGKEGGDPTPPAGKIGDLQESIRFPGQTMRNWLRTDKNGFIDIIEDTGMTAGYHYWTNNSVTLSWESSISLLPVSGVSNHFFWNVLIGAGRFDSPGQIYLNGKKVGAVDTQTIYAAKVGGNILAIVNNGGAFATMYTNLAGTSWVYKQYLNMAIKRCHINAKGTKMVVIAITDYSVNYPNDYYEAVVEYDIVLQLDNPAEPVLLVETSRTAQYGLIGTVSNQKVLFADPDDWVQIFSGELITDAWYDKDDVLKTEVVTNPVITRPSDYSYTISTPNLLPTYSVNVACNINTDSKSATGSLFMRNNPYVENTIVINSSLTGLYTAPTDYTATISQSKFDALGKITFGTIRNITSTNEFSEQSNGNISGNGSGSVYPLPFWLSGHEGFPYAADKYDDGDYFVHSIVSIQPTPHLLSRLDDATDVLSDRFGNKLYFWYDNGIQKYKAFVNNKTDGHTDVKPEIQTMINKAISRSTDILGVI